MKPVRLLKSMPPTMRIWLVTFRTKPATSYLPLALSLIHIFFGGQLVTQLLLQPLPVLALGFEKLGQRCYQRLVRRRCKEPGASRAQHLDGALRNQGIERVANAPCRHGAVRSQLRRTLGAAVVEQRTKHTDVPAAGQHLGQRKAQEALNG